ncbi:hypothetical protein ACFWBN_38920 [Streptomyces sp. NPDC059989]|uniref:hypothetical protein n=1 Tax=Streptomyces sp. NPDC059989 TaxID=3347026 RepID=UPI00369AC299
MTRSAQRATPRPRLLLLLAALLLGVVTLHTVGRPAEPHALIDVSAGHSVASAPEPVAQAAGAAADPAVLEELVLPVLGAAPVGSRDAAPLGGGARVPNRPGGPRPTVLRI